MNSKLYLMLAIASEAFGSTMLKLSEGFTKVWPTAGVAAGFLIAFFLFSLSLKGFALSTAYAIWSGVGTALTVLLSVILFQESMSWWKSGSLLLVVAGIVILTRATNQKPDTDNDPAAEG